MRRRGYAYDDDAVASRLLDLQVARAEAELSMVTGGGASERVAPKPAAPKPAPLSPSVLAAQRYAELRSQGHSPADLSDAWNVGYLVRAGDPVDKTLIASIAKEDVTRAVKRAEPPSKLPSLAPRAALPLPAAPATLTPQQRALIDRARNQTL
jgi:hypothetical protein